MRRARDVSADAFTARRQPGPNEPQLDASFGRRGARFGSNSAAVVWDLDIRDTVGWDVGGNTHDQ